MHRHPRQLDREQEIEYELNYGSELDSDEGDDDLECVPQFIPRAGRKNLGCMDDDDPSPPASPLASPPGSPLPDPEFVAPTATDQPRSMYDFIWTHFPDSPLSPRARRETFSQTNVGPTVPLVEPYDIFTAIWDRPIMEYIASETNKYAQQLATNMLNTGNLHPMSRIGSWYDTSVDELYNFFGIILAMGIVIKSDIKEYWETDADIFITPGFTSHMSRNRFLLLSRCLHFRDNSDMCEIELDVSEAKLFKIQPIVSHLNSKFQSLYVMSQNIAVDESLLQWKGWLDINQLIPNKAARVGIKTYEICESQTGYLWRFEIYAHQKCHPDQQDNIMSATIPAIVLRLVSGLEYKGYTLWMDKFYNSPSLARYLKAFGFDCAGTLRTNRKHVPQALRSLTKRDMQPGKVTGLTSGDVDILVWRYSNRVATISTFHGNHVGETRGVLKPTIILDYNIMMGGVDKKDQMLAMYPIERKRTKVWYKKLFRRLLNVSVLNSYIIHTKNSSTARKSLPHRKFRKILIKSLLSKHGNPNPIRTIAIGRPVDITHRLSRQNVRRFCAVCKKRSQLFCVYCKVVMCLEPCFESYHTR